MYQKDMLSSKEMTISWEIDIPVDTCPKSFDEVEMFLLSLITINCESMRFSLETFSLETINTEADTRTLTA